MKKRTLSLLLAAALVVGLLTTGALAAGITETLTEGYATISLTGVLSKESKTVVIDGESQEITIYKISKSGSVLNIKWDSDSSFIDIEAGAWVYAPSTDGTYVESDFLYSGLDGGKWELNYDEFTSKFAPDSIICANAMMLNVYFQFDGASTGAAAAPTDTPKPATPVTTETVKTYNSSTVLLSNVISTEKMKIDSVSSSKDDITVYTIPKSGSTITIEAWNATMGHDGLNLIPYTLNADGVYTYGSVSAWKLKYYTIPVDLTDDLSDTTLNINYTELTSMFSPDTLFCIEDEFGSAMSLYFRFDPNSAESGTPTAPEQPAAPTATPSPCAATLDGKAINLNAYLFPEVGGNSSNYVMLRDVAYLLNGTKAQFEVKWDKNTGIAITTGQPYTVVGGELQSKGDGNKPYTANTSAITVNGKTVDLTAYAIGGNNYFKLRDLGAALGFNVSWDKSAGITIDSTKPYTGV